MSNKKYMQLLTESDWSKNDIENIVKDAIKKNRDIDKDLEKKIKKVVAASINNLFKLLWQRRNFYENELKR